MDIERSSIPSLSTKEEKTLGIDVYTEEDLEREFSPLARFVSSSYGPRGRLKMFQYPGDGLPIITSSSEQILSHLQIEHPLVEVLFNGVKSHLKLFRDGGKFLICLASNLILNQLKTSQPRVLCTRINEYFLEQVLSWIDLQMYKALIHFNLDFGDITQLVDMVKTVIGTKGVCLLSPDDKTHLSILIIRGFLQTVSFPAKSDSETRFQVLCQEGPRVEDSLLVSGVLFPLADSDEQEIKDFPSLRGADVVKVALFVDSLTEEAHGIEDNLIDKSSLSVLDAGVMDDFQNMIDNLIKFGMKVLLNQKVIPAMMKRYLRSKGILVVDRLGQRLIPVIVQLIEAQPISILESIDKDTVLGTVQSVKIQTFCRKRYIHLQSSNDQNKIRTLLLCAPNECIMDELKIAVESAQCLLYQAMRNPSVVAGGGCFETQMSQMILSHVKHDGESIAVKLGCSLAQVLTCAKAVSSSFLQISSYLYDKADDLNIENKTGHLWLCKDKNTDICCCGSMNRNDFEAHFKFYFEDLASFTNLTLNEVEQVSSMETNGNNVPVTRLFPKFPDLLVCKKNAICIAFALANVILRVKYSLVDKG